MKKAILISLGALFLLPFLYLMLLSLATQWRFPDLLPAGLTAANWVGTGHSVWMELARTSGIAVLVTSTATCAGFLTARQLSGHPWKQSWLLLAYVPYAFSPVIYAHCLKFFFNEGDLSGTFPGVVLAQFILTYPYAFLLFINHFDRRLRSMEDLTYTLGGSRWTAFRRVLIPVSKGMLWLCFIQVFLISWFEYGLTSVIGLGQIRTLTVAVYQYIGEANPFLAASASCLVCLPPLILLTWSDRLLRYVPERR